VLSALRVAEALASEIALSPDPLWTPSAAVPVTLRGSSIEPRPDPPGVGVEAGRAAVHLGRGAVGESAPGRRDGGRLDVSHSDAEITARP